MIREKAHKDECSCKLHKEALHFYNNIGPIKNYVAPEGWEGMVTFVKKIQGCGGYSSSTM